MNTALRRQVIGSRIAFAVIGAVVALYVPSNLPAQPSVGQQPASQVSGPIDVNTMLQHALGETINLSQEEVQAIFGPHPGTPGWKDPGLMFTGRLLLFSADPDKYIGFPKSIKDIKSTLSHCNNSKWTNRQRTGIYGDAGTECVNLGSWLVNSSGLQNAEAETALQRGCALPELRTESDISDGDGRSPCAALGDLYRDRGELDLALAVYLHAPSCNLTIFDTAQAALSEACRQGAVDVYAAEGNSKDEQGLLASLCTQYGDRWSNDCQLYRANGGSVDLNAIEAQAAQYHQALNAEIEQSNADAVERQREHDAHMNAVIGALSGLPGASNPNGIVDTANQEAAQMVAVGAANDAARGQATTQQSQTNTSRGTQETASATAVPQQAMPQNQQPQQSTTSTSPPSSSVTETCPSPQGSQGYPDYGVGCNLVKNMNSCIQLISNTWRPNGGNTGMEVLVLSNTCSTAIRLTVGTAPIPNGGGAETQNVGTGQQFTWTSEVMSTNFPWQYQADDGTDCTVNVDRPGCSIGH